MRKPNLKKLKTHMIRGCGSAWHENPENPNGGYISFLVPEAFVTSETREISPGENYTYHSATAAVTDDLRKVTCGLCKTKLLNELWFKDWNDLTQQELDLLITLQIGRDVRKHGV